MDKILLSNIGNRNIKVNGNFISKIFDNKDVSSFRVQTLQIWQDLQNNQFKEKIEPVIINEIIENEKNELKEVIFFSSNSPEGMRNDQDTIFEGEILCMILSQKYPEIKFTNKVINASVVSHDQLFSAYRNHLKSIDNKKVHIIYCDAGGTSQQKFVCKILIEYLFNPEDFTVFYVSQSEKAVSILTKGESLEYRKIIDIEHITQAIHSSAYNVALKNLKLLGFKKLKMPASLVYLLELKSRLLIDDSIKLAKSISQSKNSPSFVRDIATNNPSGDNENWCEVFEKKEFYFICEILMVAQWKYSLELTEQAIHYFSIFIENYLYFIIRNYFGYDFSSHYQTAFEKLQKDIDSGIISLPADIDTSKKGVPVLIALCQQIEIPIHLKLLNELIELNSFTSKSHRGIDSFRNRFAHKGKAIKKEEFEKTPLFERMKTCYKLIGIDFNRNYYEELHNLVCEIIRQY